MDRRKAIRGCTDFASCGVALCTAWMDLCKYEDGRCHVVDSGESRSYSKLRVDEREAGPEMQGENGRERW